MLSTGRAFSAGVQLAPRHKFDSDLSVRLAETWHRSTRPKRRLGYAILSHSVQVCRHSSVGICFGANLRSMVVGHTFGRSLTFNPHLHILVSAGGLQQEQGRWLGNLLFDRKSLMHMWRYAVITLLRQALKAKALKSELSAPHLKVVLTTQYERWWNIDVAHFKTKWQFLRYAGRYVRRPPVAQHRFEKITDGVVEFWRKDLKLKKRMLTSYPAEEFVSLLAEHVHDRYRHAIRYFGLLAPGAKHRTSAVMFMLLGQEEAARPPRLSWRNALREYFGVDPLLDSHGQEMSWVGRLSPMPA
jgi:hypothetical protein